MGPFGPSEEDDFAGDVCSGIGDLFKIFTASQPEKKRKNTPLEDSSDTNELQEAACDELWRWLQEESYNDEYGVYHASYFVNEAHEKWKKINRKE